jgi:Ni/Fe-hydrogenase 1 B-type cytochrome subunit
MATNLTTQPPIIAVDDKSNPQFPASAPFNAGVVNPEIEPVAYRRVYVWELPVRIFHWINALTIVVLAATGFLIGDPQAIFSSNEAYQQNWFGWVRFVHFAAAYIFFFNFLFRIYWSFAGNEYASWRNYVPHRKSQIKELWDVLTTDIFPFRLHGKVSVGHNYLASFTYFGLVFLILLQTITGFALYADMSGFFLPKLFTWVTWLFGSDALVRRWHHVLMWAFIVFTIIHVYLVFYHDWIEGRGTTSSILGGWKFEKDEDLRN